MKEEKGHKVASKAGASPYLHWDGREGGLIGQWKRCLPP